MLLVGAPLATPAQDPRGRILRRVTDSSGAIVPGTLVSATNLETNVTLTAHSNEQGNYQLLYLNPGRYRLTAEHPGFKKFERGALEVRVGDAVTINVSLKPGAVHESVTIMAGTPRALS